MNEVGNAFQMAAPIEFKGSAFLSEAQSTVLGPSIAQNPPPSSSPPRQNMSAERVSIFVEGKFDVYQIEPCSPPQYSFIERGPADRANSLPPLKPQGKPPKSKGGARAQTVPPPTTPTSPTSIRTASERRHTFPLLPGRSPKPAKKETVPFPPPRIRRLGFSFARSRRFRKVVNVILGVLRLKRPAKTGESPSR